MRLSGPSLFTRYAAVPATVEHAASNDIRNGRSWFAKSAMGLQADSLPGVVSQTLLSGTAASVLVTPQNPPWSYRVARSLFARDLHIGQCDSERHAGGDSRTWRKADGTDGACELRDCIVLENVSIHRRRSRTAVSH